MSGILFIVLVFFLLAGGLGGFAYYTYRRKLRRAKAIERGLKMVPILIHLPPPSSDTQGGSRDLREVMREKTAQAEVLYNLIAGTATEGFKSKFYGQRHISLELVAIDGVVHFFAAVPVALVSTVKKAIQTAYPGARLEEVEDHNIFNQEGRLAATLGGEMVLRAESAYPISTYVKLERDPMEALLTTISALKKQDGVALQIVLRPASSNWTKRSISVANGKRKGRSQDLKFSALDLAKAAVKSPTATRDEERAHTGGASDVSNLDLSIIESIEEKVKHPGFEILIRVLVSTESVARSQQLLRDIATTFALFESPGQNGFKFLPALDVQGLVTAFIFRFFPPELKSNVLNSVELATLFHLPDSQFTPAASIERMQSKQVDGPVQLPSVGLLFGFNEFRGVKKEIRLSVEDRRRHTYILGQTGTGKSTMLENLAAQDMLAGNGFAFIDPHGDSAEKLLALVPKSRAEDVIYFNPADTDYPLGLNLFEFTDPSQKDFLVQETINMLYKLYDPGKTGIIGPRFEHWYRNAALTLMSDPNGSTFIEIPKVFTDTDYLKQKFKYLRDPTVIDFWTKEMGQTSDYHKSEMLGWFVSKFGALQNNEMMRNIIGQPKSSFNLRDVMDQKKILIVNLSKGRVGEINSNLLGMIFVIKFQAAAMSRADMPEDQRTDFSLYVDEFQNFSTDSFATILSEARKYRLNLIVANQFIAQLSNEIRDAVFGNIGTIVAHRMGPDDAEFMVKQFTPVFDASDLLNIPNFNAAVRLMVGGLPSQPFSMIDSPQLATQNLELGLAIKQLSAAKFGRAKAQVEADLLGRLTGRPTAQVPAPATPPAPVAPPVAAGAVAGVGAAAPVATVMPAGGSALPPAQSAPAPVVYTPAPAAPAAPAVAVPPAPVVAPAPTIPAVVAAAALAPPVQPAAVPAAPVPATSTASAPSVGSQPLAALPGAPVAGVASVPVAAVVPQTAGAGVPQATALPPSGPLDLPKMAVTPAPIGAPPVELNASGIPLSPAGSQPEPTTEPSAIIPEDNLETDPDFIAASSGGAATRAVQTDNPAPDVAAAAVGPVAGPDPGLASVSVDVTPNEPSGAGQLASDPNVGATGQGAAVPVVPKPAPDPSALSLADITGGKARPAAAPSEVPLVPDETLPASGEDTSAEEPIEVSAAPTEVQATGAPLEGDPYANIDLLGDATPVPPPYDPPAPAQAEEEPEVPTNEPPEIQEVSDEASGSDSAPTEVAAAADSDDPEPAGYAYYRPEYVPQANSAAPGSSGATPAPQTGGSVSALSSDTGESADEPEPRESQIESSSVPSENPQSESPAGGDSGQDDSMIHFVDPNAQKVLSKPMAEGQLEADGESVTANDAAAAATLPETIAQPEPALELPVAPAINAAATSSQEASVVSAQSPSVPEAAEVQAPEGVAPPPSAEPPIDAPALQPTAAQPEQPPAQTAQTESPTPVAVEPAAGAALLNMASVPPPIGAAPVDIPEPEPVPAVEALAAPPEPIVPLDATIAEAAATIPVASENVPLVEAIEEAEVAAPNPPDAPAAAIPPDAANPPDAAPDGPNPPDAAPDAAPDSQHQEPEAATPAPVDSAAATDTNDIADKPVSTNGGSRRLDEPQESADPENPVKSQLSKVEHEIDDLLSESIIRTDSSTPNHRRLPEIHTSTESDEVGAETSDITTSPVSEKSTGAEPDHALAEHHGLKVLQPLEPIVELNPEIAKELQAEASESVQEEKITAPPVVAPPASDKTTPAVSEAPQPPAQPAPAAPPINAAAQTAAPSPTAPTTPAPAIEAEPVSVISEPEAPPVSSVPPTLEAPADNIETDELPQSVSLAASDVAASRQAEALEQASAPTASDSKEPDATTKPADDDAKPHIKRFGRTRLKDVEPAPAEQESEADENAPAPEKTNEPTEKDKKHETDDDESKDTDKGKDDGEDSPKTSLAGSLILPSGDKPTPTLEPVAAAKPKTLAPGEVYVDDKGNVNIGE